MDFPLAGIGGFMVRQRKCHTRMRRSLSASGDAVPEGQTAEGKLEEGKWLLGFVGYACTRSWRVFLQAV